MFQTIAWISLGLAFLCTAVILVNLIRNPQKMAIMNVVWPITALYGSLIALWAYLKLGRTKHFRKTAQQSPTPWQISLAASHCGAGCVIGDLCADFLVFTLGLKLFHSSLLATFTFDYFFAWLIGIAFQYFSIVPMKKLSPLEGIRAAIKADTLSITAWQVGMYGFMALTHFVFFPHANLEPNQPQYWFLMQFAMICGFFTAYPMNYFLVRNGWKEAMG